MKKTKRSWAIARPTRCGSSSGADVVPRATWWLHRRRLWSPSARSRRHKARDDTREDGMIARMPLAYVPPRTLASRGALRLHGHDADLAPELARPAGRTCCQGSRPSDSGLTATLLAQLILIFVVVVEQARQYERRRESEQEHVKEASPFEHNDDHSNHGTIANQQLEAPKDLGCLGRLNGHGSTNTITSWITSNGFTTIKE